MPVLPVLAGAGILLVLFSAAGQGAAVLIDGTGVELVRKKCSLCHDLDHITAIRQTREEWADTVKVMISRGAPITPEEETVIVDYCAKYYGK